MIAPRLEQLLWGGALACGCMAAIVAHRGPSPPALVAPMPMPVRDLPAPSSDSLIDALDVITDGNLFRPDRARADTDEMVPTAGPLMPAPSNKPRLLLRGLLGGPPWDAIIEGIPGHDGAVVLRVGQRMGGLTVRAVRRDTVVVQGADTSWKLTIDRTW